jgi:hypothetical protein
MKKTRLGGFFVAWKSEHGIFLSQTYRLRLTWCTAYGTFNQRIKQHRPIGDRIRPATGAPRMAESRHGDIGHGGQQTHQKTPGRPGR